MFNKAPQRSSRIFPAWVVPRAGMGGRARAIPTRSHRAKSRCPSATHAVAVSRLRSTRTGLKGDHLEFRRPKTTFQSMQGEDDIFTVALDDSASGLRLDRPFAEATPSLSRARLKSLLKRGTVAVARGHVLWTPSATAAPAAPHAVRPPPAPPP